MPDRWDGPNDGRPASSSSDSPFGAYLKVNYAQGSGYIKSDKVAIRQARAMPTCSLALAAIELIPKEDSEYADHDQTSPH